MSRGGWGVGPLSTNLVMITTVTVVLFTHNLAFGVLAGVLLAAMFFANKIGHHMRVETTADESGEQITYRVIGQVFFSSADRFVASFDLQTRYSRITIDLTQAHFWDITGVGALDKVVLKLRSNGNKVNVLGLNEASATIVDRFGVHDKPEAVQEIVG